MDVTPEEHDLLARVALGESSSDPDERAGVISTVLNRVGQPGYANSIGGVVFQRGQFKATRHPTGGFYRYSPEDYGNASRIVDDVISGKRADPTGGAVNFHAANSPLPSWAKGRQAQQIGATKFYMPQKQASNYDDLLNYGQLPEQPESSASLEPVETKTGKASSPDAYADLLEHGMLPGTNSTPAERIAGGFEDVAKQSNPVSEFYTRMQSGEDIGSAALNTFSRFNQQHPYATPIAGGLAGLVTAAALPEGALAAGATGAGTALYGAYRIAKPYLKGYAAAKGAEMAFGPELGSKIGAFLETLLP